MPRRPHVVLLEILAGTLGHQGHGGGVERNGRRRPGRGHVRRGRHGRRQERPHHLVADGVDHAAVEVAHDRHFALDQRIALLESLASGRRLVEHARGHGEPAAHVDRHGLVVLGQAVVHETLLAPERHERHLRGDIGPRRCWRWRRGGSRGRRGRGAEAVAAAAGGADGGAGVGVPVASPMRRERARESAPCAARSATPIAHAAAKRRRSPGPPPLRRRR